MPRAVKLFIDSIVEDLVRVLITKEDGVRESFDTNLQSLNKILKEEYIKGGRSYLISFEDSDDYEVLISLRLDKYFEPKGKIEVKDTTQQDLAAIRRLQKKLGLKRKS